MQAAQGTDVSGGGEGGSEGARPTRLRTNDNDDVPEGGEVAVLVPIDTAVSLRHSSRASGTVLTINQRTVAPVKRCFQIFSTSSPKVMAMS